jgi:hypothetical protein
MTLSQAIHQRWAADEQLAALVPPERFVTGLGADARLPYASLISIDSSAAAQYNDRSGIDAVQLRIKCFHQRFEQAEATLRRIIAVFDGAAMALEDGREVLLVRAVGHTLRQAEDGTWLAQAKLQCAVYRPAPDG